MDDELEPGTSGSKPDDSEEIVIVGSRLFMAVVTQALPMLQVGLVVLVLSGAPAAVTKACAVCTGSVMLLVLIWTWFCRFREKGGE